MKGGTSVVSTTSVDELAFSPMARLERGDGDGLAFLGSIQKSLGLGQCDLGSQELLALDDAAPGQFLGHIHVIRGAADRLRGDAPQRTDPQHLVVSGSDLVGDGLVGPLGLEFGDVRGKARLIVMSHPPAEVADQPLKSHFGQCVILLRVEAHRQRTPRRQKRIWGPCDSDARPAHVQVEVPHRVAGGKKRQERREGDIFFGSGLLDALERHPQLGLKSIRRHDRAGQIERLSDFAAAFSVLMRHGNPLRRQRQLGRRLGLFQGDLFYFDRCLNRSLRRRGALKTGGAGRRKNPLGGACCETVGVVVATDGTDQPKEDNEPQVTPGVGFFGLHHRYLVVCRTCADSL